MTGSPPKRRASIPLRSGAGWRVARTATVPTAPSTTTCDRRAEARAAAEVEVRRDNPLAWLRYGPGRERPEESGWTQSVQHEHAGPAGEAIPVEFITRLVEEDRHDAHKA